MENSILKILEKDKNLECNYDFTQNTEEKCLINLCSNTAKAKEIASLIMLFIEWLIVDQEIFFGELTEKYIVNDNPYKDGKKLNTLDELFDYWQKEIKDK